MPSNKWSFACLLAMLCISSAACAEDIAKTDWLQGARHGWIVQIYTDQTPIADLPACLSTLPKAELAARHFAKVKYTHFRHLANAVAELPAGAQVGLDAEVEIWPQDCARGKLGRISRLLHADPH